jgi:dTDP-4-amino-4,6-dideoxy-D-glucose acyltransferase
MAFLTDIQLASVGFGSVGTGVLISDKASIHNAIKIRIGDHVRIDDFTVISAGDSGIVFGHHIHIACQSSLIGRGAIIIGDYSNISSRVAIYSSSDDFSGNAMTNPMVPGEFTNVASLEVRIGRHVVIGSGTVVLPGVTIHDGVAVGALSLVKADCMEFTIYAGIPARAIKPRSRRLLEMERKLDNRND